MAPVRTTGAIVAAASIVVLSFFLCNLKSKSSSSKRTKLFVSSRKKSRHGLVGAIGNTPLIRINSLSDATGCEVSNWVVFDFVDNIGDNTWEGRVFEPRISVKDRVAVKIIEELYTNFDKKMYKNLEHEERDTVVVVLWGKLAPGGVVTEGSAGSTAISLATVAPAYGCKCHVVIPDDVAIEKSQIIEALGATVERVRPVSITHRDHSVNIARRRASEANELASKHRNFEEIDGKKLEQINGYHSDGEKKSSFLSMNCKGGFFADQFENLANFRAHYEGTGPEIWEQTGGNLDAFVAAAGTGGTVAGVSKFLQEKNPNIKCVLIVPPGSGLFNKVTRGVMYTKEEAEGRRLKNPFDTITEGIGVNSITQNFKMAKLDGALRGTDREAVEMSRFLLKNDGLFLGSSLAMNCVGAVRLAQCIGPGHTIVTILCDNGMRHLSKFYSARYLSQFGLTPKASGLEFMGIK
ncbi:Tryptophan synthase beta subunit-like PLP-dependent enzyme [Parasponia andersonii]|uniref:cysteine synthase n=1 Tax=Parasponia andersonii TaxID=3476 RepID=A0A2P5A9Z2_PARAD|nr:Tryptophan synthase beta subunit-like PLP-dependent enzyme [Parasponia andersonii]